jgi:hypothetical protein
MGVARLDDGGSYVRGWLRRRLIEILEIDGGTTEGDPPHLAARFRQV